MAFFLFVLVNAVLFIRPSEIIPALEALPLYNILMSSCILCSLPLLQRELARRTLIESPISACVVGVGAGVAVSHLANLHFSYAKDAAIEFLKLLFYYLLLVGLLDSPARLRRFLTCLVGLIGAVALLSILHYHGVINIGSMRVLEREEFNATTGEHYSVLQLYGTGIFSDPNDLSLILMLAAGLTLYNLDHAGSNFRWLWVVPLGLFNYTMALTNSRGGFLAMLTCVMTAFSGRFGWKKAIPVAAVALPLMFVLFAGRQTDLSATSGTGQSRIQLWSASLGLFRGVPLFGLGSGMLPDQILAEAHNSFVQGYAELGFFGGTMFLGMYACAIMGVVRVLRYRDAIRDPDLRRMAPIMLAVAVGYCVGIMTLTRNFVATTYLIPGLVAAYLRLVAADAAAPLGLPRFDARLVRRLLLISGAMILVLYAYVRLFARFG